MVRFIRSTWPLVHGWLGLVRRCSIPFFADHVEAHRPGGDGVAVPGLLGELDPVVGKNRPDLVWHGLEHVLQEFPCGLSVNRCNALSDGELGCPVDADEQVELALGGLHLGNIDVERGTCPPPVRGPCRAPIGYRLNFWRLGLSPSISGRREMP